jgi:hypothetical protein
MWMIAKEPLHLTSNDPEPDPPVFPEHEYLKEVFIRFSSFFDPAVGWTYEDSIVITMRADAVLQRRLFRELHAAITISGTNSGVWNS